MPLNNSEILARRLGQQGLLAPMKDPMEVVRRLGAVQAQDYYGAKWALGQRSDTLDHEVEEAFNKGEILRTHMMRPTWHFVLPEDIRWMQALTAHRVHQANAFMGRKEGLTTRMCTKAIDVFQRALEGGKHLDRSQMAAALKKAKIEAAGVRLAYIIMHAELEAVITSGPRRGLQFTYALMDERIPKRVKEKQLKGEEALAEFAWRYFSTRGPATVQDFSWWSGLTLAETRKGVALLKDLLVSEPSGKKEPLYFAPIDAPKMPASFAHLLPNYDEYGIGYKDRGALRGPGAEKFGTTTMYRHLLMVNGTMHGMWDSTIKKQVVRVRTAPFIPLSASASKALNVALRRYAKFLGVKQASLN
jgi:hypothetical protein